MPPPGPGVAETQCTLSRAALHKGGPVPAQKTAATIARPALLAQLVEHLHGKEGVSGSSPEEGFSKGSAPRRLRPIGHGATGGASLRAQRRFSALEVEPGAAGAGVAEALAPRGEGLS